MTKYIIKTRSTSYVSWFYEIESDSVDRDEVLEKFWEESPGAFTNVITDVGDEIGFDEIIAVDGEPCDGSGEALRDANYAKTEAEILSFGRQVLQLLARDEDWSAETLDAISEIAYLHGLAESDDKSMFSLTF